MATILPPERRRQLFGDSDGSSDDSDSDGDGGSSTSTSSNSSATDNINNTNNAAPKSADTSQTQALFVTVVNAAATRRVAGDSAAAALRPRVCIVGNSSVLDALSARLKPVVELVQVEDSAKLAQIVDVIVGAWPGATWSNDTEAALHQHLVPRGLLVVLQPKGEEDLGLDLQRWVKQSDTTSSNMQCFRSRGCMCNTQAVEWADNSAAGVVGEHQRLEAITLYRCAAEIEDTCLSRAAVEKAVAIIQEHGLVIIPRMVPTATALKWGDCMLQDFAATTAAMAKRGMDVEHPDRGTPIENFYEIGMRQPGRCDLRHGKAMRAMRPPCGSVGVNHAPIRQLLQPLCNPGGAPYAAGNWGRWNFEGGGPGAPKPPLIANTAGAVIAMPGADDQLVHADTEHLYEHAHLPPHYLNFFFPAANDGCGGTDLRVGQTAFIVGSHKLRTCMECMDNPAGDAAGLAMRKALLVRPHLRPGDALLFDVRTLHFGLANRSGSSSSAASGDGGGGAGAAAGAGGGAGAGAGVSAAAAPEGTAAGGGVVRPVIYVNFHQPWWNRERVDKNFRPERLFPEQQESAKDAESIQTA